MYVSPMSIKLFTLKFKWNGIQTEPKRQKSGVYIRIVLQVYGPTIHTNSTLRIDETLEQPYNKQLNSTL